jgi:hypothetical protein
MERKFTRYARAFGFLPGATGGMYPANLQRIPSIFLPFSNLIELHVMISPLAASSDKCRRTFASEIPMATAISLSSRSPYFFRYSRISFMIQFQKYGEWIAVYTYITAALNKATSRLNMRITR